MRITLIAVLTMSLAGVACASKGQPRPAGAESEKYTLAIGLGVVGRIDDALRAVEQGLALQPKSAADWNLKALLVQDTDPGGAVSALRRSLELDGSAAHVQANLACALFSRGERVAFEDSLTAAEKRGTGDPVLALMRARIQALAEPAKAKAALEKLAIETLKTDGALAVYLKKAVDNDLARLAAAQKAAGAPGAGWAAKALDHLLARDIEPEKGWIEPNAELFEWIARMDPEVARARLEAAWEKRPGRARFTLALVAMRLNWPSLKPLFERGLADGDGDVRGLSGTGLAMLGARDAAPAVRAALAKETHGPARWCMVESLARLGDASVLPELIAMSKNKSEDVARMAVLFLPALAADGVVPALADALEVPHATVRRAAHWTLESLTNQQCPCGPRIGTEICVKHFRALFGRDPRAGRAALPMRSLERKHRGLAATVLGSPDGRKLAMGIWELGQRFVYDMEALERVMPDQPMQFFSRPR